MSLTRSQRVAEAAFRVVHARNAAGSSVQRQKYLGFARAFPTLIHTSGLVQASAFALAKKREERLDVLNDLAAVLERANGEALHAEALGNGRAQPDEPGLTGYLRLTREALAASTWIKRYAEALLDAEL